MRRRVPTLAGAPSVTAATATTAARAPSPTRVRDWASGVRRRPPSRAVAGLGGFALLVILVATAGIVLTAASGPSILVPRSGIVYPAWQAGPLHGIIAAPFHDPTTLSWVYTITIGAMFLAYGVAILAARRLPMRVIVLVVLALHAILLLGPPGQLNDVFNYLAYARLGALHHLDPYSHVVSGESWDPIFRFASWDNLRSPYGELFTMLTYPLAFLGLPVAYWILKSVIVALSLAFLWLVWRCARALGRDGRAVVCFVALNPIYLIYAVGAFHNDFLMLVPSTAAILLALRGRDAGAGATLVLAIAVKFTAVVLGPFLLIALGTRRRCARLIAGGVVALVPVLAVSLVLFGTSLPNVSQQSSLLTMFSVPNLAGLPFGVGGSPLVLHLATLSVALVAVYELVRLTHGRTDWLAGAGWVTFALILSLSWAVPWYVVWLLPLAALCRSRLLRVGAFGLTLFLLFAFVPVTSTYVDTHRTGLYSTPAGRASQKLQNRLAN